jgi:glycosyltransferase involved in cell wall biosynthesis
VNMGSEVQSHIVDVSVIIPTYNRASLVVEAIESVFRQTALPREIIVIDDGSTDDTARVLKPFEDRIMFARQENQGVGAARNRALAMANGQYLAFLDSDDIWLEFKLEMQVAIMEKNPAIGFLFSDFLISRNDMDTMPHGLKTWYRHPLLWQQVLEDSVISTYSGISGDEIRLYCGKIYRALLWEPYVLPSCALVRTDRLTADVRFATCGPVCTDWEFFARLARTAQAAYMEFDTVINRGGNDRPRLTQTRPAVKAQQRLRMIRSVWKADDEFCAIHGREVTMAEANQCIELARASLFESQPYAALKALHQWWQLGEWLRWKAALIIGLCVLVPASGAIARIIRELRARLRRSPLAFSSLLERMGE